MPAKEAKQIIITVPAVVEAGTAALAKKSKLSTAAYAAQLFIAAYSARVKPPTGDNALDAAVARIAILYVEERDTVEIADAIGISEATVCRVLDAWRAELGWAA